MITKAEAIANLTAQEEAEFNLWEQRINAALKTHNGRTVVDCPGLSARVRDRIIAAGHKAGWTVEFHDNQFDGASLSFR